jgi:hypothetical protein
VEFNGADRWEFIYLEKPRMFWRRRRGEGVEAGKSGVGLIMVLWKVMAF